MTKDIVCNNCGKHFDVQNWVYNNRIKKSKSGNLFCSKRCAGLIHSKQNSPNWKGGVSKNQYNRYVKPYPKKYIARNKIQRAVRDGKIKKKICQKCNNIKSEAHHPDYNKPLGIIWLCRKCHIGEHNANRI